MCLQHKALLAAVKGPGGGRDEEDTSLLSSRAHCARAREAECHGPELGPWVVPKEAGLPSHMEKGASLGSLMSPWDVEPEAVP